MKINVKSLIFGIFRILLSPILYLLNVFIKTWLLWIFSLCVVVIEGFNFSYLEIIELFLFILVVIVIN